MNRIKGLVDLVYDGIAQGTLALEEAHIALVNEPIVLLKHIPSLEPAMQLVQSTQTEIIRTVYEVVRTINEGTHSIFSDFIRFVEKHSHVVNN